jgi:hypothetical protein
MTKLPTPEQWTIVRMSENELAEEIERHIDYVDKDGQSVHLPMQFVRHYMKRDDEALPTIVSIATSPIVLADGGILAFEDDIDVERGIDFAIPKEVMALLPRREDCTPSAVKEAMEFLTDNWLHDGQHHLPVEPPRSPAIRMRAGIRGFRSVESQHIGSIRPLSDYKSGAKSR